MKRNQSGFTLIEIAIVLVIIGLLLGGVLKGQELINSAKVKNLAQDFRNIPLYIYGYQDKFKALPGDDANANTHLTGGTLATTGGTVGNGLVEGLWDSNTQTEESVVFWQHVRLAGLMAGATIVPTAAISSDADPYLPHNAVGGRIGVESGSATPPIVGLKGSYFICSKHILGRFAKQLDTTLDDGKSDAGSLMVTADTTSPAARTSTTPATIAAPADDTLYTVCMGV